jgi:hypothetical protein
MRTSHLPMRMSWLGLISCVVLALLLVAPSTAPATTIYVATLTGANEVGPTGSPATGFSTVTLNGNTLTVDETFSGLVGGSASAAHIHCCVPAGVTAGIAVPFVGFPAATSGSYSHSFDLTLDATYNPTFEALHGGTAALAEADLIAGLDAGLAYANIHDAQFPGGEIRGQLERVPGPPTVELLLLGLTTLVAVVRRRAKPAL